MILVISLLLPTGVANVYAAESEAVCVTAEEAKFLAVSCVWNIQEESTTIFEQDLYLGHTFTMYDVYLNESAYVINFEDKDGDPNGYVIVSATNEYPEVIEFSDEGMSPYEAEYDNSMARGNKGLPIFDGNIQPLNSNEIGEIKQTRGVSYNEYNMDEVYALKEKSQSMKDVYIASGGGSTIGEGDFIITNPKNYESSVYLSYYKDVTKYNITYSNDKDFPAYTNVCGPIAATNIMRYWRNRDVEKYAGLMVDGSWNNTFLSLYDNMYYFGTTAIVNFVSGATSFAQHNSTNGISFKYYLPSASTFAKMKTEIQANRPFVLLLQDHGVYGNHYVVGLGYYVFEYSNGTSSNYIRIADGWISTPSRYIYYNTNVTMYLITAIPA